MNAPHLPTVDPDRACRHPDFGAVVSVARVLGNSPAVDPDPDPDTMPVAFVAEIQVKCAACGEPFRFTGCTAGLSYAEPRVSVDEATLHAPIRPASADPDFGMGLPGFAVRATYAKE